MPLLNIAPDNGGQRNSALLLFTFLQIAGETK